MKKETLKEAGKLLYDFAKIIVAIALITPLAKGENLSLYTVAVAILIVLMGTYLINKGAKDE